jgi:radical SAM superfamily enzyme YgiQ (UPF0313 family)
MSADVLLLYPPTSQVRSPHLAIPLLQAYLAEQGVGCDIRDLNLACFQYFISPSRLDLSVQRISRRLGLEAMHPQAYPMNARMEAEAALLRWEHSRGELEDSLALLSIRTGDLPSEDVVQAANRRIGDAFSLLSAEFYPVRWEEEIFSGPFDTSRCEQVVDFASRDRGNPFAEFWQQQDLAAELDLSQRRLVGISICFLSQLVGGLTLARCIRSAAGAELPVVIGGPVAMYMRKNPKALQSLFDSVSCVVYGEGELPLLDLHRAVSEQQSFAKLPVLDLHRAVSEQQSFAKVPGILFRDAGGTVQINPHGPAPRLNSLPRPTFEQLPLQSYLCNHLELPIFSERGCYYGKCAFCCVDLSPDRRFDSRRASLMVEDLAYYKGSLNATHFLFITTALPAAKARNIADHLCDQQIRIQWGTNIRYEDRFTDKILQRMADSGCLVLNVGLESGSDRIISLMDKGFTIAQAESFHARARKANIRMGLYIMLGFPGETGEDRLETARVLTRLGVGLDDLSIGQFVLHEFAPMFQNPEAHGLRIHDQDDALSFELSFSYRDGRSVERDLVGPFKSALATMLEARDHPERTAEARDLPPQSQVVRPCAVAVRRVGGAPARYLVLSEADGSVCEMADERYVRTLELADEPRSIQSIATECGQPTDEISTVVTELISHGLLTQVTSPRPSKHPD